MAETTDSIRISINKDRELSSKAESFYKDYWTDATDVDSRSYIIKDEIIKQFFPERLEGKRILEIGVGGEGGLIIRLVSGNEVHGVDVSEAAERNCLRMGLPFTRGNLDSEQLPFPDSYFDIVFAFEVFEHFSNPQFALEEIRRLLKDDGFLLVSAPTPWCYHYPRLFYPALFKEENFTEFLMVNGFTASKIDNWFIPIRHNQSLDVPARMKVWNWFWKANKVGLADAQTYYTMGSYFWNKINEFGLRENPLEALDLFRKSYLADGNEQAFLALTHALFYRFLYNDVDEFSERFKELFSQLGEITLPHLGPKVLAFIKIVLEARRFGICLVEDEIFDNLLKIAQINPELTVFMRNIRCSDAASFGEKYA